MWPKRGESRRNDDHVDFAGTMTMRRPEAAAIENPGGPMDEMILKGG
jgi:hypothetical protein